MNMKSTLLFFSLLVLFSPVSRAADAVPPKIKVLIIDGFSNHDWRQTTELIKGVLQPTGLFELTVSTSPPAATSPERDQWRPRFKDYDVVIQTCNDINNSGPSWPKEVQDAFAEYVRDGGGVYIFHGAQNAFADWPAYNDIIGLGWRVQSYGTAISIDENEKLVRHPPGEGMRTSHAPQGEVLIHRLGDHPIHQGLPRAWKTTMLEVYFYARGPAENVKVLSYARDPRFGLNWPVEWTVNYGRGRAYIATFGHVWKGDVQPVSMRCAGVQTILPRVLQWLARRPVTYPVPVDFPTETTLSIRPEIPLPAAK